MRSEANNPAPSLPAEQVRRYQLRGMQLAVFTQRDPAADPEGLQKLADEEGKVSGQTASAAPPANQSGGSSAAQTTTVEDSGARLTFLMGPDDEGLSVTRTIKMQPLPTGIYHLLNPEKEQEVLVEVRVENKARVDKRVCVKAYVEGLSAQAVHTKKIRAKGSEVFRLLPTLLPRIARAITEVQRATLHTTVEDLEGRLDSHDTVSLVCLARTSSFNAVYQPATGEIVDLSHYYGAWVTPYAEPVQERIRRAADLLPSHQIWGYQGKQDSGVVTQQVKALYSSLREAGIVYVNSVIDYGAPPGLFTQRTRLPRESLASKSANCIDGTVLMASLLEGASLNPAIVLVPGHAFLGWQSWPDAKDWSFLETTMIGSADFEAAVRSGQQQYETYKQRASDRLRMHPLYKLRADGIWPME